VAIGRGVQATRANQVALGSAANTYTFAGVTSAASTAAQTGPTQLLTTDANGNIASDGGSYLSQIRGNNKSIKENTEGVAMAMAMAGSYLPREGESFRISGNWGNFEGSNAMAFNAALLVQDNIFVTAGIGYGINEKSLGGRAGVSIGW